MLSASPAGASTFCSVCAQRCAIYTCPRCEIRTCSLACSKTHKTQKSCSGERDKTAYVPMNRYGWGDLANDYVFLEEISRKTVRWGSDIVEGGFLTNAARTGRGRERGRGRHAKTVPRGGCKGKRNLLKMQLDARDIDIEMLPPGMEKRRLNQSTWDAKLKSPLLTVEFVFHPSKDQFAQTGTLTITPFPLLTHRNSLTVTLSDVIRKYTCERGKRDVIPLWIKSLLLSPKDQEGDQLVYLMAQHSGTPSDPIAKSYHKLDPAQNLLTILRHRTFVEYPTIDVWKSTDFTGALVEADGTCVESNQSSRPVRHRQFDAARGRQVIRGLLGGYGSQEEEKGGDDVMGLLDGYGSDEVSVHTEGDDLEEPIHENVRDIFGAQARLTQDPIHWSEGGDSEGEEDVDIDWDELTGTTA